MRGGVVGFGRRKSCRALQPSSYRLGSKPVSDGGREADRGKTVGCQTVVAVGDVANVLEMAVHARDSVAPAIEHW